MPRVIDVLEHSKSAKAEDDMSSSLLKRILSALILAPCFLYVLYVGDKILASLLLVAFGLSIIEWYSLSKKTTFFSPIMTLGIIYMAISFSSFLALREVYSLNVLLVFVGMIWFSDIGAFFVGKFVGGPKLIKEISPNKTWSGFGGALFFPAFFAVLYVSMFGFYAPWDDTKWYVMLPTVGVFGAATGAIGQAGDLLVSFIKRQANVKDTGTLIPGHGGLLDRIDSMLLGAPVYLILITLVSYVF